MSTKFSFGKLQLDVSLSPAAAAKRVDPEAPFCLGIVGDFSGRAGEPGREAIAQRRIRHLDSDNFEKELSQLGAKLRLTFEQSPGIDLTLSGLEDFHPDRLLTQVPPLAKLCEQRRRLLDPATAPAAVTEMQRLFTTPSQPAAETADTGSPSSESETDTLARLLGGTPTKSAPRAGSRGAVESLLRSAVAPSVVPDATPHQTALLSVIDLELSKQLRAVVHHPRFQALEAAWRGLDLLVRNFGAEENLKLFILDISKEELQTDLQTQATLDASGLWKALRRQSEDRPWALWVGLYAFENSVPDIETLARLAKLSAGVRAPLLTEASPHLVGCDSFALHPDPDDWNRALAPEVSEAWEALRELPEAAYLGLALPRFLFRQPYGKSSDPIDTFPFQELDPGASHESFLWGNPALACTYLLASAFQADGWDMQTSGYGELGDLPVYQFKENGETKVKPCAEAWLSDRADKRLLANGLMPLLSIKGRDAVRLPALQSLAGKALQIR
ncbi:MAG TPA: type VI secretion system contractile sheath large subunit [Candidatus Acidoferrum sp.]|jgi:type VI secretion system protein ImpC|nr:type VI secretion system contractile sheath large subunit [Candidatus Acidoferrum sp.]